MKHLPNLLSFARIALTPLVLCSIWARQYELAILLCFVAAVSDALDGFFARRWSAASRLGAYLDPIADKILLTGIFLTLALDRVIPWWLATLVLGRDALILGFIAWAFRFTALRSFPPSLWGKLSTMLQIMFVLAVLMQSAGAGEAATARVLLWLTAGATAGSGLHYAWLAARMLRTDS